MKNPATSLCCSVPGQNYRWYSCTTCLVGWVGCVQFLFTAYTSNSVPVVLTSIWPCFAALAYTIENLLSGKCNAKCALPEPCTALAIACLLVPLPSPHRRSRILDIETLEEDPGAAQEFARSKSAPWTHQLCITPW